MTFESPLYSVLKQGLDVLVDSNQFEPYCSVWVELVEFSELKGKGNLPKFNYPELEGATLEFELKEILTVRGTMEWNIENLYISCSKKVLEGEPVGYFHNAMLEKSLHYGRCFYAESEINAKKDAIELHKLPLKTLLSLNKDILPHKCVCLFWVS